MSEPFIGEVRIVAFNFAPRGWAFCDGALLPISQNTALFSLLGTTYGGNGTSTFALPDIEGRVPLHPGRGPGLTAYRLGETGGAAAVTLAAAQIPAHTHLSATTAVADRSNALGTLAVPADPVYAAVADNPAQRPAAGNAGAGAAHNNMQPYLGLNFCIALVGLYPSRS